MSADVITTGVPEGSITGVMARSVRRFTGGSLGAREPTLLVGVGKTVTVVMSAGSPLYEEALMYVR